MTSLYAHVHAELTGAAAPSPNLVKALLIHSALLSKGAISATDMKYRGFGVPGGVLEVLSCAKSAATLIFEPDLISNLEFEKVGFPIPASLRDKNGKVRGEFAMTLVFDPPCDAAAGAETAGPTSRFLSAATMWARMARDITSVRSLQSPRM